MTNKTLYTILGVLFAALALVAGLFLSSRHFQIAAPSAPLSTSKQATLAQTTQIPAWLDAAYPLASAQSSQAATSAVGSIVPRKQLSKNGLIVNFWATWCPPCIKELPLLDQNQAQLSAKAQAYAPVLALAIDKPDAVQRFLSKQPLPNLRVAVAGQLEGLSVLKKAGNDTGQLPYTIVLDSTGAVVHKHLGELDAQQIIQLQSFVQSHTK